MPSGGCWSIHDANPLQAYADYHDIMILTEDLIKAAAQTVTGGLEVEYQGQHLDFGQPFRRASMHDLVKEVTGILPYELPSSSCRRRSCLL